MYYLFLVFGVLIGVILREVVRDKETLRTIRSTFSFFALTVLLPVHVLFSVIRLQVIDQQNAYVLVAFVGILTTLTTLLVGKVFNLTPISSLQKPHVKWTAATFGGGGRAVVLATSMSILIGSDMQGSHSLDTGDVLNILVIFDLGYWLFFAGFLRPIFMPLTYKNQILKGENGSYNQGLSLKDMLSSFATFIALVTGVISVSLFDAGTVFKSFAFFDETRKALGLAIVFLTSATVVIAFQRDLSFVAMVGVFNIFIVRLSGVTIVILLLYPFMSILEHSGILPMQDAKLTIFYLMFPLALFLLSPPSSFIPAMLEEAGAPNHEVREASTINVLWNLIMFVLVGFTLVVVLLQAVSV